MLNVGRLRTLKEVAYRGSFSAAADALSYTQSAVSQQIAALEAEAGLPLLERHPRGVSLTAAGQTLVAHAEGILARLDSAEAALSAIAGLRGGRVRMASFPPAGGPPMPGAVGGVPAAHPVQALGPAGVGVALPPKLALSAVRDDIVPGSLPPAPPLRRVIAATPAGARLVPGAPAMLGVLAATAERYEKQRGRPAG